MTGKFFFPQKNVSENVKLSFFLLENYAFIIIADV